MQKELPLFPLNLVAFPGETLNLHIFEPRYKQLIADCMEKEHTFGIPSFVHKKIELGTEMEIVNVKKVYSDGRMDISTRGINVFEVIQLNQNWNGKTYAGGTVAMRENNPFSFPSQQEEMFELISSLFKMLHMDHKINVKKDMISFDYAHKIGLKVEEEYKLLQLRKESDRQDFVITHLKKLLPALERAQSALEKIKLNGHFKHLTSPDF